MVKVWMEGLVIEFHGDIEIAQGVDAGNDSARAQVAAGIAADELAAAAVHFRDEARFPGEIESTVELVDVEAVEAVAGDGGADRRPPQAVAESHQHALGEAVRPPDRRDFAGDAQPVVDPQARRRGDPPLDPAGAGEIDEGQIETDVLKIAAPVAEQSDQPALMAEGPFGAHQFARHARGIHGRNMEDFQLGQGMLRSLGDHTALAGAGKWLDEQAGYFRISRRLSRKTPWAPKLSLKWARPQLGSSLTVKMPKSRKL